MTLPSGPFDSDRELGEQIDITVGGHPGYIVYRGNGSFEAFNDNNASLGRFADEDDAGWAIFECGEKLQTNGGNPHAIADEEPGQQPEPAQENEKDDDQWFAAPESLREKAGNGGKSPPPPQDTNGDGTREPFDWAAHAEAVVADIFGEPNAEMSRPPEDVRFGNHGSVSVNYTTGKWYDFENEHGGGIKELIRVYKEIDDREAAIAYAEECQQNFENDWKPRSNGGSQPHAEREQEAIYQYLDASRQLAFEVVRYVFPQISGGYATDAQGKRKKTFSQRRPSNESDQSWLWGLDAGEYMRPAPEKNWISFNATKFNQYPTTRQRKFFDAAAPEAPYQLPDLLKAVAAGLTICIAEGEKKVDLIRSFGFPATCCAGGAKKWRPEHSAFLQGADVVLLPDNDSPGHEHKEAIIESLSDGARRIRILELPNLPEKGDVDDWHAAGGSAEEFARLINAAQDYVPDEAAGPQPLMRPLPPPEPFPLEALGPELASTVQAIRDVVQSPIEMCASAVLAATSFAVSAHVNITLPTDELKPVVVWIWSLGVSGERKSATDKKAFAAQMQHERQLFVRQKAEMEVFGVRKKMWEARKKAIETEFKKPGAAGSEAHQKELEQLGPEPEEPLGAILMASNFTFEGMVNCLHRGQPLYGIIGAEGGQFIGGHGMKNETKLNTIANLNFAWDGDPMKKVRAKDALILYGRRVGMHLMVQPEVAAIALTDDLLIQTGFTARILMCVPESLIGTRMHKDPPPEAEQILQQYKDRVLNIITTPYQLASGTQNELEPRNVTFSAEAAALYWKFSDEVEREQLPGGEYDSISAFASKLAEHAARLSAAIAAYHDLNLTELSYEDFLRGMKIAAWYATEAKRISGANTATSELTPEQMLPPAQKLLDWLLRDWTKDTITARDIYIYGPRSIRDRQSAIEFAEILVRHGWLIPLKTHRHDRKKWQITKKDPTDEHA